MISPIFSILNLNLDLPEFDTIWASVLDLIWLQTTVQPAKQPAV